MAAAALSLALMAVLILLSQFKHGILLMTRQFPRHHDRSIPTASRSCWRSIPISAGRSRRCAAVVLPADRAAVVVRSVPRAAARGRCSARWPALRRCARLSLAMPNDLYEEFDPNNFVSKFARSGVTGVVDLYTRGYLESDAVVTRAAGRDRAGQLRAGEAAAAHRHGVRRGQLRHHARAGRQGLAGLPGPFPLVRRQVARAAGRRRRRAELVHRIQRADRAVGASFGRFADFVTRIAAGRVERGLPHALRRCGYKTFSLYPMWGCVRRRARSSRPRPASSISRRHRTSARSGSSRTASITTRPRS